MLLPDTDAQIDFIFIPLWIFFFHHPFPSISFSFFFVSIIAICQICYCQIEIESFFSLFMWCANAFMWQNGTHSEWRKRDFCNKEVVHIWTPFKLNFHVNIFLLKISQGSNTIRMCVCVCVKFTVNRKNVVPYVNSEEVGERSENKSYIIIIKARDGIRQGMGRKKSTHTHPEHKKSVIMLRYTIKIYCSIAIFHFMWMASHFIEFFASLILLLRCTSLLLNWIDFFSLFFPSLAPFFRQFHSPPTCV